MIAIDRTRTTVPEELALKGPDALNQIRLHVEAGTLKSNHFSKSIYASDAVRKSLWEMQFHKCCFCEYPYEKKFSTVEHFRPKTSSRNQAEQRENGYWWLGYEFNNLYFCCSNCNTPKSDWFPLNSGQRYQYPDLPWVSNSEDPLILDPGSTRPEDHLCFVRHPKHGRWRIAGLDDYGIWTIRAAQLDRDDLNELRDAFHESTLRPIIQAAVDKPENWDWAQKIARKHCEPCRPFSLLARAAYSEAGLLR